MRTNLFPLFALSRVLPMATKASCQAAKKVILSVGRCPFFFSLPN